MYHSFASISKMKFRNYRFTFASVLFSAKKKYTVLFQKEKKNFVRYITSVRSNVSHRLFLDFIESKFSSSSSFLVFNVMISIKCFLEDYDIRKMNSSYSSYSVCDR